MYLAHLRNRRINRSQCGREVMRIADEVRDVFRSKTKPGFTGPALYVE